MSTQYAYHYAIIDLTTGMCIEVRDTTDYCDPEEYPEYIPIDEPNGEYLLKYYHNGTWYLDANFTQVWDPNA